MSVARSNLARPTIFAVGDSMTAQSVWPSTCFANNLNVDLETLEIRMSRSENLPTLPQAASHVLRLADDSDVNQRELERAIEMDPALVGKILKIANSSYYGSAQVRTLGRAISFLGMTAIRSAVVSMAMQQMVSGRSQCPRFDRLEFWKHCMAVAVACRIIGKLKMPGSAEELYCAGLMHEIGLLAMAKFSPQELNLSIEEATASGESLIEVERELLGFTHVDVGFILARNWSLNPIVVDAIQYWSSPEMSVSAPETTTIVATSKSLASSIGFKSFGSIGDGEVYLELAPKIGIPEQQFGIIGEVIIQEILKAQDAFQIAA